MTAGLNSTIGIVGAGSIAAGMHVPVLRAMAPNQIAWITDANSRRGSEVARTNGLSFASLESGLEGLPKCDVVLLAIPLPPRRSYFDHFESGSTAVLAEKPLAVDAREHRRLAIAYPSWKLSVGYQRRFYATSALLRRMVRAEPFGPLLRVNIREGGLNTRTGGVGLYQDEGASLGGGIVRNLGCHSLDLAFWITEAGAVEIDDRSIEWDGNTDRSGSATIKLLGIGGTAGKECELRWKVSSLEPQPNVVELQFENASIRCSVGPSEFVELVGRDGRVLSRIEAGTEFGAISSIQAFYLEWVEVLSAVSQRRDSLLSASSCLMAADVMDALLERPGQCGS